MKVVCLIENLEKNSSFFTKVIPANSQIPILQNVLLEAKKDNFYIWAVDTEISIKVKIPGKIEEEGRAAAPGKQFLESIASLPKDKVEISSEKESLLLKVREYKLSFQTQPSDDFPDPFSKKGDKKTEIDKEMLKKIFKKTAFSTASEDTRPEITGTLFLQKEDGVEVATTDGYRLSFGRLPSLKIGEIGEKMIFSKRLLEEASGLKTEKEKIDVFLSLDNNQASFETEDALLVGRLIEGKFPNYEKVVPVSFKTRVAVDKEELLRAARLLFIFSRDNANIIKVRAENSRLYLSSVSKGIGQGEIGIETEHEGEGNEIYFNAKFLIDFLRSADSEKINISINSAIEPALFREEGESIFSHVIMPVRIHD